MAESLKTWQTLIPSLSEAQRRWYVGQKALELGRGGIEQIHALTGISRTTIIRGIQEVKRGKPLKMGGRVRKRGGGRKAIESVAAEMVEAINEMLEESTAGNPMSLLKWMSKTCRSISDELKKRKFDVSIRLCAVFFMSKDTRFNQIERKKRVPLTRIATPSLIISVSKLKIS